MSRAKELTEAHWDYIKKVLRTTGIDDEYIEIIGFHYCTALFHGYNHGWEDAKNDKS